MRVVLSLLPALGCAAVMFACVRMMAGHGKGPSDKEAQSENELAHLRKEVARLKSERPVAAEDPSSSSNPTS